MSKIRIDIPDELLNEITGGTDISIGGYTFDSSELNTYWNKYKALIKLCASQITSNDAIIIINTCKNDGVYDGLDADLKSFLNSFT